MKFFGIIIVVLFFGYRLWLQYSFKQIFQASEYEWKIGNKEAALKIFSNIPDDIIVTTHPYAITKAYWFWQMNNVNNAIKLLESHHKFHCNQRNHTLLGRWYMETGDFPSAETHMLFALHITPHLLESRFDLMKLYDKWGKREIALYWANELINYPIKINSEKAIFLKNEAKVYIDF